MKKILIAGGTGFIGKSLIEFLLQNGFCLHVLTRQMITPSAENVHYYYWNIEKGIIDEDCFKDVEIIINLTGSNIAAKRWTKQRKRDIVDSRINAINLLFEKVKQNKYPIEKFICSSAVGFYGAVTCEAIFDETSKAGNDFLGAVCSQWEMAALQFEKLGIATVIFRKGVVIAKNGGMFKKMAALSRLGINTSVGSGRQYLPWVDLRDLLNIYLFFISKKSFKGIFNVVASEFITMNDFSKQLLKYFKKKSLLPNLPSFILRFVFGELSVMLLEGTRISNEKLKKLGYKFEFDTLEQAFESN
ncbi:MAG TPA: TIGR01777 family oxidoreductase [Edaphocola sp.]|nr:TIGR01777 family oxidoreductase [Edaphocola sp.]